MVQLELRAGHCLLAPGEGVFRFGELGPQSGKPLSGREGFLPSPPRLGQRNLRRLDPVRALCGLAPKQLLFCEGDIVFGSPLRRLGQELEGCL